MRHPKETPADATAGSADARRLPRKGKKCPACGSCKSHPCDGDERLLLCSECEGLWLLPPEHGSAPKGIRQGRRCILCGHCTVAMRELEWLGTTVRVLACRNTKCGSVCIAPTAVAALSRTARREATGFSPLQVAGGLSDLLDKVRRSACRGVRRAGPDDVQVT